MAELVRLYLGPLDGMQVVVPDGARYLKVVQLAEDQPEDPEAVVITKVLFYVFTGFSGRLDYQPFPH